MNNAVKIYVIAVALAGATAFHAVSLVPADLTGSLPIAFWLATIGLGANLLSYQLRQGGSGAVSFIPFLATLVLIPNIVGVTSVILVVAFTEAIARRQLLKASFNIAQQTLSASLAVLIYLGAGGRPVGATTDFLLLPQLGLFISYMLTNSLSVSTVIALNEQSNVWRTWRANNTQTVIYDLGAFPFVYFLARCYSSFGPVGIIAAGALLLGGRQLYKINRELESANHELLKLMVAAIEARDPYTSGHSRRVSYYARLICDAVGIRGKQVDRIEIAALLHDVGKIHEMFAPLLRKPERLTPEEMAVMQTHSIKSAELVANVSHLKDVLPAVRHHHERWDGTGYPDRLASDEIPLAARIIMIADTIDAMTSDRPYRKALAEADVRAEMTKLRGKQFDPALCDSLLASPTFTQIFTTVRRDLVPVGYIPSRLTRKDLLTRVS